MPHCPCAACHGAAAVGPGAARLFRSLAVLRRLVIRVLGGAFLVYVLMFAYVVVAGYLAGVVSGISGD